MSGGPQQRVAIARALANWPKLLLADEPTGALDHETGLQVIRLLRDASKSGKAAVVVVTHDETMAAYADRVIRLRDGRVVSDERTTSGVAQRDVSGEVRMLYATKLLRELRSQLGQTTAVFCVTALGVLLFVASAGAYLDLRTSYSHTRAQLALADLHIDVGRVTDTSRFACGRCPVSRAPMHAS